MKIIIDNQEHFVESILRKELIEDFKTRERKTIFWCQTKDKIYKLIRFANGDWELANTDESKQKGTTESTRETQKKKLMQRKHENMK